LELVTRDAQFVSSPEERAAADELLVKAQHLSNVGLQPYDLKTTFVTNGSLPSDGAWTLEDIWSGDLYRWAAQGPSYSGVFLLNDRLFSSNQQNPTIPLRLLQVRHAIFYPPTVKLVAVPPCASLRLVWTACQSSACWWQSVFGSLRQIPSRVAAVTESPSIAWIPRPDF
jgi:hypothetical protein